MIKKVVQKFNFDVIEFPVKEKGFNMIEIKNNKCLNIFGFKKGLLFPIYVSDQMCGDSINLLPLIDDDSPCKNWIHSSLFQLSNEKSNKSQI